uniref:Uncharacterized protein n=1 Tax=Anopheles atroparvus TaxID=41427 RepID=A0A182IPB1_ANOAO
MSPYGGFPSAISRAVMPSDQMSATQSYPISSITSGAIQNGVPMTVFRFAIVSVSCPATPKSASFAWPSELSSMLPALMSRWILRRRCRYSSPLSVSIRMVAISSSERVFLRSRIMSDTLPAPQYSITIHSPTFATIRLLPRAAGSGTSGPCGPESRLYR